MSKAMPADVNRPLPAPVTASGPTLDAMATRRNGGPRSLGSNVAWTLSGNIGYAACLWFILVALAKLGSPEMVGQFALGLGLTAPIMLLSNLNLRAVQATDTRNDHAFSDYLRLRMVTTAISLLACLGIAAFASFSLDTALVVGFMALAKASESLSDVYYGRLQKHERMDRIARSMLARGILSVMVMSFLVWATGSVVWGSLGLFLTWFAVLLAYDIRFTFQGEDRISLGEALRHSRRWSGLRPLLPLAWLALPLGIVQMLISLNANVPRFFIQVVAGEHELGIYSAIAYVTVAGSTVVASVGQAVSPRLALFHAQGDRPAFLALLGKLAALFTACCALGVAVVLAAGGWILTILYTAEYAHDTPILLLLTLSFGVGAIVSVCGFGITAARRFRSQVPLVAVAVTVATVASAVLIPRLGTIGGAWAVLLSLVAWAAASGYVLWTVFRDLGAPVASVEEAAFAPEEATG